MPDIIHTLPYLDEKNSAKYPHPFQTLSFLIAAAFITLLTGCNDPAPPPSPAVLPRVKAVTTPAATPSRQINWAGKLVPESEVSLAFRLPGRLSARYADVGSHVKAGTVLAVLDASLSREQSQAAKAALNQASAQEHKARLAVDRVKQLIVIGTASQARLEEAQAALASAQAQKAQASAQAAETLNASDLNRIKAPFDGVITAVMASPGQMLSQGQQVMQLVSDENKQVMLNLPLSYSAGLHPGNKIKVRFSSGKTSDATVLTISPQSDTTTQLIAVKAAFENQRIDLPFNTDLTGSVIDGQDDVITIPASALTRKVDKPAVFVISPGTGKLALKTVAIKYFCRNEVAISAGLNQGEKVVVAGVSRLEAGMKVVEQDGTW
ncbi:hypothetical protein CYR32_10225 [Chimaeribacter coloradensis]|uniref:Uncharacterized protein n=1 Tax=Chimaeribacter coloradensis TaxID=2060068 RepID=A0A2N5E3Z1_9GAMM|nr:efflux RND transporter periplasmic adaptor subunit [Chimaeribacter coloradensis]PLR35561.1 hypothetical protein CYR32_10225 [Chimaeribacter coloradensis]